MSKKRNEKFAPVPHTREDDARLFADPAFKAAWDALEEEYVTLGAMLKARKPAGFKCTVERDMRETHRSG